MDWSTVGVAIVALWIGATLGFFAAVIATGIRQRDDAQTVAMLRRRVAELEAADDRRDVG